MRATTLPETFTAPSLRFAARISARSFFRRDRIEVVAVDHDSVDRARGGQGHRALIEHVLANLEGVALQRIAEPPAADQITA